MVCPVFVPRTRLVRSKYTKSPDGHVAVTVYYKCKTGGKALINKIADVIYLGIDILDLGALHDKTRAYLLSVSY